MASSEAPFELSPFPNPSTVTIAETGPIEYSNSNMDVISAPKPKKKQGRIKIAIEKIQNKNRKHVTFSKRRKGLFKKATELCVLCDASVSIITFSEAGKVFTFGHPSTDAVIHRYLHGGDGAASSTPAIAASSSHPKLDCSGAAIGDPFEDGDRKLFWWDRPVEELGFEELESFAASLEQFKSNVERRITDLDLEYELKLNAVVKSDFDYNYEHRPIPIPIPIQAGMAAMSNQMNNYYNFNGVGGVGPAISFGSPDFLSMPPPPVGQDQDAHQYQYCGRGCITFMGDDYDDISSIIAMAKFDRSGRGFGGY